MDSGRLPLRPGHCEGGLPAALPQPREGWLWGRDAPRPFLPGVSRLFLRGPVALPKPVLGWGAQAGGGLEKARHLRGCPAGGKPCEAAQLFSLRPALALSFLQPLSALGLRAKREKRRKRESFFKWRIRGLALQEGLGAGDAAPLKRPTLPRAAGASGGARRRRPGIGSGAPSWRGC